MTDLVVQLSILVAIQPIQIKSLVINVFLHSDRIVKYFILAESNLNGSLTSSNPSDAQPRIGSDFCVICVNGTLPDINGQRLDNIRMNNSFISIYCRCISCANVTPHLGVPPGTIDCCLLGSSNLTVS